MGRKSVSQVIADRKAKQARQRLEEEEKWRKAKGLNGLGDSSTDTGLQRCDDGKGSSPPVTVSSPQSPLKSQTTVPINNPDNEKYCPKPVLESSSVTPPLSVNNVRELSQTFVDSPGSRDQQNVPAPTASASPTNDATGFSKYGIDLETMTEFRLNVDKDKERSEPVQDPRSPQNPGNFPATRPNVGNGYGKVPKGPMVEARRSSQPYLTAAPLQRPRGKPLPPKEKLSSNFPNYQVNTAENDSQIIRTTRQAPLPLSASGTGYGSPSSGSSNYLQQIVTSQARVSPQPKVIQTVSNTLSLQKMLDAPVTPSQIPTFYPGTLNERISDSSQRFERSLQPQQQLQQQAKVTAPAVALATDLVQTPPGSTITGFPPRKGSITKQILAKFLPSKVSKDSSTTNVRYPSYSHFVVSFNQCPDGSQGVTLQPVSPSNLLKVPQVQVRALGTNRLVPAVIPVQNQSNPRGNAASQPTNLNISQNQHLGTQPSAQFQKANVFNVSNPMSNNSQGIQTLPLPASSTANFNSYTIPLTSNAPRMNSGQQPSQHSQYVQNTVAPTQALVHNPGVNVNSSYNYGTSSQQTFTTPAPQFQFQNASNVQNSQVSWNSNTTGNGPQSVPWLQQNQQNGNPGSFPAQAQFQPVLNQPMNSSQYQAYYHHHGGTTIELDVSDALRLEEDLPDELLTLPSPNSYGNEGYVQKVVETKTIRTESVRYIEPRPASQMYFNNLNSINNSLNNFGNPNTINNTSNGSFSSFPNQQNPVQVPPNQFPKFSPVANSYNYGNSGPAFTAGQPIQQQSVQQPIPDASAGPNYMYQQFQSTEISTNSSGSTMTQSRQVVHMNQGSYSGNTHGGSGTTTGMARPPIEIIELDDD